MWITILQFFASLSILVVLHEMGHFLPAKWFKTKVEKFYLFFDPYFSLFKFQKGDTEYGIGWLPLGGYVKIAGMIDESFDKEQMEGPAQPWEFRSKPAWQRLIIMLGGVTVNFILGVLLFSMIFLKWGDSYIVNDSLKDGIYVDSIAHEMGLRDGDLIKKIGENEFTKFSPGVFKNEVVIKGIRDITVQRNNADLKLPIDEKYVGVLSAYANRKIELFGPRVPTFLDSIATESGAAKAGLLKGDQIVGINGIETKFFNEFQDVFDVRTSETLVLEIIRDGRQISKEVILDEDGKIGVYWKAPSNFLEQNTQHYSFSECFGAGWNRSLEFLGDQIHAFSRMFTGQIKAKDSLGSFISIGKMFGTEWDWRRFWAMTAMLSLLLGFINLLPIPALDGGHVMFLLWEVLTGKKPSDKFLEIATLGGFIILIIIMVYALGLDIVRHLF